VQQRITIEAQENHAVGVVSLQGELDLSNAQYVEDAMLEHVDDEAPGLVADLTDLHYVDSAGIRLFVEVSERLHRNRQAFALAVPPSAPISRTLSIVKLDLLLPIHETVEGAVEGIVSPPASG
jgi:anti-sigma B factor antagonist